MFRDKRGILFKSREHPNMLEPCERTKKISHNEKKRKEEFEEICSEVCDGLPSARLTYKRNHLFDNDVTEAHVFSKKAKKPVDRFSDTSHTSFATKNKAPGDRTCHPDIEHWKTYIKVKHPDIHKAAIFVPPVHANKELLKPVSVKGLEGLSGIDVNMLERPVLDQPLGGQPALQDSSVRDDESHRRVLCCLKALNNEVPQVMTVVSQLQFQDYLNDPCYKNAAATLPRPVDLDQSKRRGDFDILIIHPQFGLLILEIKSVGDRFEPTLSQNEKGAKVVKKIEQAINQLNKGKEVLKYLVSDKPCARIRTSLVLPNVTKDQLDRILTDHVEIRQSLCRCLDIQESDDPVRFCLCADKMSAKKTPSVVTAGVMRELAAWWHDVFACSERNSVMTDDDYVDIVARFCGPATFAPTFQVVKPQRHKDNDTRNRKHYIHTQGEAASEIGDRFSRRVLHQDQVKVLEEGLPCRFICGPPGAGKSVVLMLMARKWLLRRRHVHIASTWSGSLAASLLIASELADISPDYAQRISVHQFDLKDTEGLVDAVKTLLKAVTDNELFVICDEAFGGSGFGEFCTQLNNNCNLHLWAASVYHGFRPGCMDEAAFSYPLRTPPVVTQEVAKSDFMEAGLVRKYTTYSESQTSDKEPSDVNTARERKNSDSVPPQPCDGLPVVKICHQGQGHSRNWPGECDKCGEELGQALLHCIGEGTLTFRDVLVLTTYYDLVDALENDDGNVEKQASGLVRGLRKAGVPVWVVGRGDSDALAKVVAMKGLNAVIAADADTIRGLERKVAVWVQVDSGGKASGEEDFGRLDAMSRTTAQLIVVA